MPNQITMKNHIQRVAMQRLTKIIVAGLTLLTLTGSLPAFAKGESPSRNRPRGSMKLVTVKLVDGATNQPLRDTEVQIVQSFRVLCIKPLPQGNSGPPLGYSVQWSGRVD